MGCTTPQFPQAVEILKVLKAGDSEVQVCIGGPHATLCPTECLGVGFDAVVVGDGELAIHDFLAGERGIITHTVPNIDQVPFPDRSLVQDYDYRIDGEKATTIMTSRGSCPYRCAFCSKSWPYPIKFRSPENVRAEMKEIKSLGYNAIMIYDDEFFLNPNRDYQICLDLWKLGFVWRCFTRSNLVNENMAEVLAQTGCREVLIGVESGSNTILKNIHKGVTVQQNIQAIETLHKNGVRVKAAMIVMLPGESEETLKETWSFCERVEDMVSDWDFTLCTAYPGSPIYKHPEQYDLHFDKAAIYSAYKGAGSPHWKPQKVWTSKLTFEEGLEWRDKFEKRVKLKEK